MSANVTSFTYQVYSQAIGYELYWISFQDVSHVHNCFAPKFGLTVFQGWNSENLATVFEACINLLTHSVGLPFWGEDPATMVFDVLLKQMANGDERQNTN